MVKKGQSKTKNIFKLIKIFNAFNLSLSKTKIFKKSKKFSTYNYHRFIKQIKEIKRGKIEQFNKYYFYKNSLNQVFKQIKSKLNDIQTRSLNLNSSIENPKHNQKIAIVFYSDRNLLVSKVTITLNNKVIVNGIIEVPIPANVIGDSLVEDKNELANITLDSLSLLESEELPLLIVLSSSLFNINSFDVADLKQISLSDSAIQKKSPYLPDNTVIDFYRGLQDENSNKIVRAIYTKKDFIKSWTDALEIINSPVLGLVPAAPPVFDMVANNSLEELSILVDIEFSVTSVLIGSKFSRLTSYRIPFGSSLYISSDLNNTTNNYFERILNSIKLILDENNCSLPLLIYVMGNGLDSLVENYVPLPKGFKRLSELKLTDYYYSPNKMKIHELVSKSVDSNIESLVTILKSCL